MKNRLITLVVLSVAALWGTTGCMNDTYDPEEPVGRLEFAFTQNSANTDQLAEKVKDMYIYVFDTQKSLLAQIVRLNSEQIAAKTFDLTLPEGEYTFVVWGGSGTNLLSSAGGFADAQVIMHTAQTATPVVIGQTKPEDLRIMLQDPSRFDDLFFDGLYNVPFNMDEEVSLSFDLTRYSHILRVNVTGLDGLYPGTDPSDWTIYAEGQNASYNSAGSIDPDSRNIPTYPSVERSSDDGSRLVDIHLLRLDVARRNTAPIRLHVADANGADMIPPINITQALMDAPNSPYRTQTDFDRAEVYSLEVSVLVDMSISITIPDYDLLPMNPGIGK